MKFPFALIARLFAVHEDAPPANSGASKKQAPDPAKDETPVAAPVAVPAKDPLIKTVSEVAALSLENQAAFRAAGGTAIEDPA